MSDSRWAVTIERTEDNRYMMTFGGKIQLGIKTLITGLAGF